MKKDRFYENMHKQNYEFFFSFIFILFFLCQIVLASFFSLTDFGLISANIFTLNQNIGLDDSRFFGIKYNIERNDNDILNSRQLLRDWQNDYYLRTIGYFSNYIYVGDNEPTDFVLNYNANYFNNVKMITLSEFCTGDDRPDGTLSTLPVKLLFKKKGCDWHKPNPILNSPSYITKDLADFILANNPKFTSYNDIIGRVYKLNSSFGVRQYSINNIIDIDCPKSTRVTDVVGKTFIVTLDVDLFNNIGFKNVFTSCGDINSLAMMINILKNINCQATRVFVDNETNLSINSNLLNYFANYLNGLSKSNLNYLFILPLVVLIFINCILCARASFTSRSRKIILVSILSVLISLLLLCTFVHIYNFNNHFLNILANPIFIVALIILFIIQMYFLFKGNTNDNK